MNKEQLEILAAFDATMQALCDVCQNPESPAQVTAAYGGASAMLILVKRTTDINEKAKHAAQLLNEAAALLGLPQTN